jgi:hypothetical protein
MGFVKKERMQEEPAMSKEFSPVVGGEMPPVKTIPSGTPTVPEVVNRLEELVQFALECEGRELREGVSFVDIFKQLEEVRHAVEYLNQDQKELLSLFSMATGEKIDMEKVALSDEDKKIVGKLRHLQSVCEAAKQRMYVTTKTAPEAEVALQEKIADATTPEAKKIARRKEKFRPLGGKEGWLRT